MRLIARFVIVSLLLLVVACAESGGESFDSRVETTVAETSGAQTKFVRAGGKSVDFGK